MSRKAPPPPLPVSKPGTIKVFRALYKYTAQNVDELSFEEGDLLYVSDQSLDPNWWKAKCKNNEGLIPATYVEEQTQEIQAPLHEAARRGNLSFMQECIRGGVSASSLDSAGNTAIYWAARAGHVDCVKELLAAPKSTINARNKMGDTPLHVASSRGHLEVVQLLLKSGADVNAKNSNNLRPEDMASDAAIVNAIQLSQMQSKPISAHQYNDHEYDDDSD